MKNQWIQELQKILQQSKSDTILEVKLSKSSTGIDLLSARTLDNRFLNYIGNSEDNLLGKEYEEKFLKTFGRLTKHSKKGKENV